MQFSVRMELHGKCVTSIFPYMEIVWLAFLVNPGCLAVELDERYDYTIFTQRADTIVIRLIKHWCVIDKTVGEEASQGNK